MRGTIPGGVDGGELHEWGMRLLRAVCRVRQVVVWGSSLHRSTARVACSPALRLAVWAGVVQWQNVSFPS